MGVLENERVKAFVHRHREMKYVWIGFLFFLLILTIFLSDFIGSVRIPILSLLEIYGSQIPFISQFVPHGYTLAQEQIIIQLREPEIIGGVVIGASLGIGGAAIQSIFRNPITEPYIIGLSSGASLGAVASIVLGLTIFGIYTQQIAAFIFGLSVVFIVYFFALKGGKVHPTYLLLTGVAVSFFVSAIVALLLFTNINLQGEAFFWLLGSLENINWTVLYPVAIIVLITSYAIYLQHRELDAIQMGDMHARSVGVNVERTKRITIFMVALGVSASVSISGLIGFVGLIMPHLSRMLLGGSNKHVIPASGILGAIFLICADDIARGIVPGVVIPIGIVTGIIGVPFLMYFMRKLTGGRYEG
jgi:iron complex transport system permease protein